MSFLNVFGLVGINYFFARLGIYMLLDNIIVV